MSELLYSPAAFGIDLSSKDMPKPSKDLSLPAELNADANCSRSKARAFYVPGKQGLASTELSWWNCFRIVHL